MYNDRMIEKPIRVAVAGAAGRMGQEVLKSLTYNEGFDIVLAVDKEAEGKNCRDLVGPKGPDLTIESKLGAALERVETDVLVDFTHHSAAAQHAVSALKRKVCPVIGTTGMGDNELRELALISKEQGTPGIYAPNFAIGAVLMMRFAHMAARWMPDAEIIEMHHDKKEDAPSGTAMLTADLIAEGRTQPPAPARAINLRVEGARGGRWHDTQIHSVRLQGLVAHQQVMFGGPGESLTLRHDSIERSSFMSGVKLCVRTVRSLNGLVIGMDKILFSE
jgi:4-hydroxy-tetrahydrodipicolinate reductase